MKREIKTECRICGNVNNPISVSLPEVVAAIADAAEAEQYQGETAAQKARDVALDVLARAEAVGLLDGKTATVLAIQTACGVSFDNYSRYTEKVVAAKVYISECSKQKEVA